MIERSYLNVIFNEESKKEKPSSSVVANTNNEDKTELIIFEAGILEMNLSEGFFVQDPLMGG